VRAAGATSAAAPSAAVVPSSHGAGVAALHQPYWIVVVRYRPLVGGLPPHAGLLLGGALALTAVAAVLTGLVSGRDTSARRQDRVRELSGAWAAPRDEPDLRLHAADPARIVLGTLAGKTIANPPRRSLMVLAPTGAGKTPRVVVPAVLRHHGPALVASVKSDVLLLTQAARARSGPVWVFDPTGATGLPAARWSPLAAVASYGDAMKAAAWLTDSSKVDGRGVEDQRFWDALGRKLLAPLLFAAAGTGRHIADVVRWVDYRAEDEVQDLLDTLGDPDAIAAWAANRARPDKTKGSVYGTAEVVLESFGHPAVRDALATAAGDPAAFDHTALPDGGTLYLVAPATDQALFTPVFETLTNAVLREVERRAARGGLPLSPPLLLMLDEAANNAPLRRLDQVASQGANEGVIVVSVWQDEGQIVSTYGQDRARTVNANHVAKLYLPGINDEATLRAVSESIGDHQVRKVTESRDSTGRLSRSTQLVDERLAPPAALRKLTAGTAIVLTGSHKPMRLRVPGWYEDRALRALVDPAVAAAFDAQFSPPRRTKARV